MKWQLCSVLVVLGALASGCEAAVARSAHGEEMASAESELGETLTPTITSITPSTAAAGTVVDVRGTGLSSQVALLFGGAPAAVQWVSLEQVRATVPVHPTGTVDVVAANPIKATVRVNGFTIGTGTADLIVTAFSMSPAAPTAGQVTRFSATIRNQGTAATPPGVINGVVFSVDGTVITWSDDNTTSIPPGGSVTVTANGGPTNSATWTASAGTHSMDVWVNDANRYPELSTTNNHLIVPFTVAAAAGPADMVVTGVSMSPANPVAGQAVTFSATIRNQGASATPAGVKNGVVFTVDGAFITWSDNNTASIPPGGSVTVTANGGPVSATWPATAGAHSLDAWVNDANRYPESSTTNNHLVTSFNVGSAGGGSTTGGPAGVDAALYTLTFVEDFNAGFDRAVWNDHIWYEASNPTINYQVSNGSLKIWPQRDANGNFFNRTIDTDGKYYQTYGFFEIEAKLPKGKGTWPAFWLFNHIGARRPEIDVMEAYAGGLAPWGVPDSNGVAVPTAFAATIWLDESVQGGSRTLPTSDLSAAFHKYGLRWEPQRLTFYFDGTPFYSANVTMSDPMYLMLDLWYGSASGTPDNSTPQGISNSYEINYVKAWRLR